MLKRQLPLGTIQKVNNESVTFLCYSITTTMCCLSLATNLLFLRFIVEDHKILQSNRMSLSANNLLGETIRICADCRSLLKCLKNMHFLMTYSFGPII